MTANLATFVDRYTMKHVRVYPHPVDRVWKAITDDKEASNWLGFTVRFDLKVGGVCQWGPPDNLFYETKISRLEPTAVVQHDHVPPSEDGYMLFELEPHSDGCRLNFVQHFDPAGTYTGDPDMPGGDQPGGPNTPWQPNFVGGFHSILDNLGNHLDGAPLEHGQEPQNEFALEVIDHWLWRQKSFNGLSEADAAAYRGQLRNITRWNELNVIYREHIRETIPSE